jgi:hypothetical protein
MCNKKIIGCNILAGQSVWQVPAGAAAHISSSRSARVAGLLHKTRFRSQIIGCYVRYRMQYHKSNAMSYIGCNMRNKKNIGWSILAGQRVWQVPATKLDCNIKYWMLCQISDAISQIECNVIYRMQYAQKKNIGCNVVYRM